MSLRVLHITSWYPSAEDPVEGIFVKEHIESLEHFAVENHIVYVRVSKGSFGLVSSKIKETKFIHLKLPFQIWFFTEVLCAIIISHVLIVNRKKFDLVNFHIAYPNLVFWKFVKLLCRKPVVCTEHWTAYGRNFGLPKTQKSRGKLRRVRNIFANKILFLFVSENLANQVKSFSETRISDYQILPNVVNPIFRPNALFTEQTPIVFFAASVWREGKRPFELIKSFHAFSKKIQHTKLILAGDGPLFGEMKSLVSDLNSERIQLVGRLNKIELAQYLKNADALCLCSDHETFSVICAEALCSGCPVIASNLPAVREYLNDENSIIVPENNIPFWENAFGEYLKKKHIFNRGTIARNAQNLFSSEVVGKKYFDIISNWHERNS